MKCTKIFCLILILGLTACGGGGGGNEASSGGEESPIQAEPPRVLNGEPRGNGISISNWGYVVVNASNNTIYAGGIGDDLNEQLVVIDYVTGDRSAVIDTSQLVLQPLISLRGLAVDNAGNVIWGDANAESLYLIRPSVNSIEKLASIYIEPSSFIQLMNGLCYLESTDSFYTYVENVKKVISISRNSGLLNGVFENQDPSNGQILIEPLGIDCHPALNDLILADSGLPGLVAVNRSTGKRRIISSNGVGDGPHFEHPVEVAISGDGGVAYVTDNSLNAVFSVDLATGARRVITSAEIGNGPVIESMWGIDVLSPEALLVHDDNWRGPSARIVEVFIDSGDRSILSGGK